MKKANNSRNKKNAVPKAKSQSPVKAVAAKSKKLLSREAYQLTMQEIEQLMKIGEDKLTKGQVKRLRSLAEAAEHYEDTTDPLTFNNSGLQDVIKVKLFEMGINQSYAAVLLGVSNAKFSLIMSGKQKPDVHFIKAVHDKLKIDANLILQAIN